MTHHIKTVKSGIIATTVLDLLTALRGHNG